MLVVAANNPKEAGSRVFIPGVTELPCGQELASAFRGYQFGLRIKKGHFAFMNMCEKELAPNENVQLFDGKYYCQLCSNIDVNVLQEFGLVL